MRKNYPTFFLLLMLLLLSAGLCCAETDPILLNKPNPLVAASIDDFFMEMNGQAVFSATLGSYSARSGNIYLIVPIKVLFLLNEEWDEGFDNSSFSISHSGGNGTWSGTAEAVLTGDHLLQRDFDLLSDTLHSPAFNKYRLIFSVPNTMTDKTGWTLHFEPTQYIKDNEVDDWDFDADVSSGTGAAPVCGMDLAFSVQ